MTKKPPYSLVYAPDEILWTSRLQQILDGARRRIAAGEGIPHDQFWNQMAKLSATTKTVSQKAKSVTKKSSAVDRH